MDISRVYYVALLLSIVQDSSAQSTTLQCTVVLLCHHFYLHEAHMWATSNVLKCVHMRVHVPVFPCMKVNVSEPHSQRGAALPPFLADDFTPQEEVTGAHILPAVIPSFLLQPSPDSLLIIITRM